VWQGTPVSVPPLSSSCKAELESSETYKTEASSEHGVKLLELQICLVAFSLQNVFQNWHLGD
jgi:hypothetical protein